MSFLSRIIGDNHLLKGPNISTSPTCAVDLSGTKLTIPAPLKTLMAPVKLQPISFDIHNQDLFSRWKSDSSKMSVLIHENGWKFNGRYGHSFGYVRLDIRLVRFEPQDPYFNFGNLINLKSWLLQHVEDSCGKFNQNKIEEHNGVSPKKHLWSYPVANEHIFETERQEKGLYFFTSRPTEGIHTHYWIPIAQHHVLEFEFISNPLDCDFYSPEHNLPEATEQFIKTFMKNVDITLSPDALAQKLAAEQNRLLSQENKSSL